jgi:hypothetical protein
MNLGVVMRAGIGIAAAAMIASAGFAAGRHYAAVSVAEARESLAEVRRAIAVQAAHRLMSAHARSDTLTRQLSTARLAAAQDRKERNRAIAQLTDAGVCLREPALRVLDGAPGIRVDLPDAGSGAAGADAGRVATNSDIAGWALDAGSQYAECARRLTALINWHQQGKP